MSLNSTASTLIVGIPSVVIAAASYAFAVRARRQSVEEASRKVDAEAYLRARDLYESSLAELRMQVTELREEVDRLKDELAVTQDRLRDLQQ